MLPLQGITVVALEQAVLRATYPRLVICGISGYGTSGPYKDKKSYDLRNVGIADSFIQTFSPPAL